MNSLNILNIDKEKSRNMTKHFLGDLILGNVSKKDFCTGWFKQYLTYLNCRGKEAM